MNILIILLLKIIYVMDLHCVCWEETVDQDVKFDNLLTDTYI